MFVEHIARGLVALGHRSRSSAQPTTGRPPTRSGTASASSGEAARPRCTPAAGGWRCDAALGHVDAYVDVQNGIPFFARLASRTPVIVLVHHVHREQWPVVYPGLAGRVGWAIESQVARRAFAGCQYVAVSRATRAELIRIGVRADDIAVVHNGAEPRAGGRRARSPTPLVCTLGRLVPHKQVEHAIDAVAALARTSRDIRLVGRRSGWWEDEPRTYVAERGLGAPRHVRRPRRRASASTRSSPRRGCSRCRRSRRAGGSWSVRPPSTEYRRSPTAPPAGPPSRSPTASPACSPTTARTSRHSCDA